MWSTGGWSTCLFSVFLRRAAGSLSWPRARTKPIWWIQQVTSVRGAPFTYHDRLDGDWRSSGRPQVGFDAPSRMSRTNETRVDWLFANQRHELPNELQPPCHQGTHRYPSMYGRLHWDRPAQTVTTGYGSIGQGRNVHPLEQRLITPHEAARLQTFPDSFDFGQAQRKEWAKMIGNAVPPLVNMTIGMSLIPALREPSEIARLAAAVR